MIHERAGSFGFAQDWRSRLALSLSKGPEEYDAPLEWRAPALAFHLDLLALGRDADGFGVGAGVELRRPALHDGAVGGPGVAGVNDIGLARRLDGARLGQVAGPGAMLVVELARLARRRGLEGRGRHRT